MSVVPADGRRFWFLWLAVEQLGPTLMTSHLAAWSNISIRSCISGSGTA